MYCRASNGGTKLKLMDCEHTANYCERALYNIVGGFSFSP